MHQRCIHTEKEVTFLQQGRGFADVFGPRVKIPPGPIFAAMRA